MADSTTRPHALATRLIHAGEVQPRIAGAVSMPIFQSSTFEYTGQGGYHDLKYIRLNNTPNHQVLHAKLSAITGGEGALVAASGMAAISAALLAVLRAGDHLLVQESIYGGTHGLIVEELVALGIEHDFIDADAPASWPSLVRPTTRAIYVESATNPLVQVADLEAVVAFARAHELVSMIDNTFLSPVLFRPLDLGFDLELHSATKYLNGHSDIVAGVVVGRRDLVEKALHRLSHLGGSLDPHACFLLHRGLKTLELRVERQSANALALARALEEHPAVERVYYPGLPSHPRHERAKRLFRSFGGMLAFELAGGQAAAERLLEGLTLPISAPSLGGVESLVIRPAISSHAGLEPAERLRQGIRDDLLRVSVGIEDAGDLIADFRAALATA